MNGKDMFQNVLDDIVDENETETTLWEEEINTFNTKALINFTQYSSKQQIYFNMEGTKHPKKTKKV